MACEGRGTGFWGSSETVDLVALGRGVMEIGKGAPSATRNQKRSLHDEQLRKPSPSPCEVIRTPSEDKRGGSVHTQEAHTGTPKGVAENVTWRSRPDFQTVSVRRVEAESDEETEPEIWEVDEFPMADHNPPEIDFPVEITPLPQIGLVVGGGSRLKNDEVTSREGPKTKKSADEVGLGARLVEIAEQTRKKKMAKLLELRGGMAVDVSPLPPKGTIGRK